MKKNTATKKIAKEAPQQKQNNAKLLAQAEKHIPLDKLLKNLKDAETSKERIDEFAILLGTGCFAPVHLMHTEIFDVAKKWLETKKKVKVIAGYISPSHDDYVLNKMRKKGVSKPILAKDRMEMCSRAVQDSDYLALSSWEATQSGSLSFGNVTNFHAEYFTSHPAVTKALVHAVLQNSAIASPTSSSPTATSKSSFDASTYISPLKKLRIYFVCGADLLVRAGFRFNWEIISVICIARPGATAEAQERLQPYISSQCPVYLVEEGLTRSEDLSSTMIRSLVAQSKGNCAVLNNLVHPKVIEYLNKRRLLENQTP